MLHEEFANRSRVVAGRFYGVAIGPRSTHGTVLVNGYPVSPRAPLLLDGSIQSVQVELVSYYPGAAHLMFATCPHEIPGLMGPRATYESIPAAWTAATNTFVVPFSGRNQFTAKLFHDYPAAGTITVTTKNRWYYGTGASDYDEDTLNTYTEATLTDGGTTTFHETERCDAIVFGVIASGVGVYRAHLLALDGAA